MSLTTFSSFNQNILSKISVEELILEKCQELCVSKKYVVVQKRKIKISKKKLGVKIQLRNRFKTSCHH